MSWVHQEYMVSWTHLLRHSLTAQEKVQYCTVLNSHTYTGQLLQHIKHLSWWLINAMPCFTFCPVPICFFPGITCPLGNASFKRWVPRKLQQLFAHRIQIKHPCLHPLLSWLKGTVQWQLRGVKISFNQSILMNSLVGKCPSPCPNGHHQERSINIFSICSTLWHCPNRLG
jgi:hypothetical protein